MENINDFSLPHYNEIPGVGLFLEQVAKYINEYLEPLGEAGLTGSMISNYVKKDIIDNPVKKQYSREQIAYLIFIAIAKLVLSLDDIVELLKMQKNLCDVETAYEYFRIDFPLILEAVFSNQAFPAIPNSVDEEKTTAKLLTRNVSIAVAHKVYLDKTFKALREKEK